MARNSPDPNRKTANVAAPSTDLRRRSLGITLPTHGDRQQPHAPPGTNRRRSSAALYDVDEVPFARRLFRAFLVFVLVFLACLRLSNSPIIDALIPAFPAFPAPPQVIVGSYRRAANAINNILNPLPDTPFQPATPAFPVPSHSPTSTESEAIHVEYETFVVEETTTYRPGWGGPVVTEDSSLFSEDFDDDTIPLHMKHNDKANTNTKTTSAEKDNTKTNDTNTKEDDSPTEKVVYEVVEGVPNLEEYDEMKKLLSPTVVLPQLPELSIWCTGDNVNNRECQARNICFDPKIDKWFGIRGSRSVYENVPVHRFNGPFLSLSTVLNHNVFYWNFLDVKPDFARYHNVKVRFENSRHVFFSRLHPENIMHNMHDDALGLYYLLKRISGYSGTFRGAPFHSAAHKIMFLDGYGLKHSSRMYQYFTSHPLLFKSYLMIEEDTITCFKDAFFGMPHMTTWYDYGFFEPQGPLKNKTVNGEFVREVAEYLTQRIKVKLSEDELPRDFTVLKGERHVKQKPLKLTAAGDFPDTDIIAVLSRKGDRLILNENELIESLEKEFGLKAISVSNEQHTFEQQVALLKRARIAVGMHGSILAMGMFLRRGSVLVEMFPCALNPDNYTPYKTMANLPNMGIIYRSWVQSDYGKCVGHPEYHRLHGGLSHLTEDEQKEILGTALVQPAICCSDTNWLFHIYQDTTVSIDEIIQLLHSALDESREYLKSIREKDFRTPSDFVPPIIRFQCLDGEGRTPGVLWAGWDDVDVGADIERYHISASSKPFTFDQDNDSMTEFYVDGITSSFAIPGFEPGSRVYVRVGVLIKGGTTKYTHVIDCRV